MIIQSHFQERFQTIHPDLQLVLTFYYRARVAFDKVEILEAYVKDQFQADEEIDLNFKASNNRFGEFIGLISDHAIEEVSKKTAGVNAKFVPGQFPFCEYNP